MNTSVLNINNSIGFHRSPQNQLATVEYYGGQISASNFWFGIDWLDINYTGNHNAIQTNKFFEIEELPYKSPIFERLASVMYKGQKLGEFRAKPYSDIIGKDLIQFKLNNIHLYSDTDLFFLLNALEVVFNLDYKSLSRLDIALDFNRLSGFSPSDVYHMVSQGYLINKGKANMQPYFRRKAFEVTGWSIGSKNSKRKYLRCYNKSLEMETQEKEHIKQVWEAFRFDMNNVWRLEMQLQSKWLTLIEKKRGEKLHWMDIMEGKTLNQLLKMAMSNFFDLLVYEDKPRKLLNAFEWVPWKQVEGNFKAETQKLIKLKRNSEKGSVRSRRVLLKGMFRTYYELGQDLIYVASIIKYINDYDLGEYWSNKVGEWLKEFRRDSLNVKLFDLNLMHKHFEDVN